MKDRYNFDKEFHNLERLGTNDFDDMYLSTKEDERIAARRQARIEKANRDVNVLKPEDLQKAEQARKKKKIKINRRRAFAFIAAFVIVIAIVAVSGVRLTKLQVQKRNAEKELDKLKQKKEQLEAELQELDSDEYVENSARVNLHMIREGEVMYVVNPDLEKEEVTEVK